MNGKFWRCTKQSVIFQTHSIVGNAPEGVGKMIFHRYGGSYFLSEVWVAANSAGRQLFMSEAEKELARRSEKEIAVLHAAPAGEPGDQGVRDLYAPR